MVCLVYVCFLIFNRIGSAEENPGALAFYKGIAPRLMKISIGQAITFTAYEVNCRKVPEGSTFDPDFERDILNTKNKKELHICMTRPYKNLQYMQKIHIKILWTSMKSISTYGQETWHGIHRPTPTPFPTSRACERRGFQAGIPRVL